MTIVTDIQVIRDRVDGLDKEHTDNATMVGLAHGGTTITRVGWKQQRDGGELNTKCVDCNEPEFVILNVGTGAQEKHCRDCINATRKLSLVHSHMITHI
jgi:hypothetical protein